MGTFAAAKVPIFIADNVRFVKRWWSIVYLTYSCIVIYGALFRWEVTMFAPKDSDDFDDTHPIDTVESLAEENDWEFDRVTDDQIAVAIQGQWRTYSLTLAWNAKDSTLRLICTFELEPPEERYPALYDLLNRCNDMVWTGAFTWWVDQKLIVWRYGLAVDSDGLVSSNLIGHLIANAVMACERFYPAIQSVLWGAEDPCSAIKRAINEVYGRA
jgi:hypothetical protein